MAGEMPATQRIEQNMESLRLHLTAPADSGTNVYIAGNFNDWKAGQKAYRLEQTGPGQYRFEFLDRRHLPSRLEYKYHRGDWDQVELDQYGNMRPNRVADIAHLKHIEDQVPCWMQDGRAYNPAFLPIIQLISEQFEIPQLIKTRRIAALLPHDYHRTDKRYPVLYLQDGQNLFDDYAPFGNWAVDKKLALMAERGYGDVIIVSIDHAEAERIAEFTPAQQTKLGTGDGKKYASFLAETLKPYVDQHFRTLPDRAHTGIGGSSMGGLISIYAGLLYPHAYSKLLIFSPALWVMPHIHSHFLPFDAPQDVDIYLYGGGEEGSNMIPNLQQFKQAFEEHGRAAVQFKLSIDPHGKHNEARWGEEFPKAIEWLFFRTQENY
jgi:predicted alpha/beta superfamily hydrolase